LRTQGPANAKYLTRKKHEYESRQEERGDRRSEHAVEQMRGARRIAGGGRGERREEDGSSAAVNSHILVTSSFGVA